MNVLILGGSSHIGYETSIRILSDGGSVTFLLRRKNTFDEDPVIQKYIKSGHAKLSIGDALKEEDVAVAWKVAASANGLVDAVLYSIGGTPKFTWTGFTMEPLNLCTKGFLNILETWPKDMLPQPKLITVTSNGLTKRSHNSIPFIVRMLFVLFGAIPHKDKMGVERLVAHVSGTTWTEYEPNEVILPANWKNDIPSGWLKDIVIVRPALLTDGKCMGDDKADGYRTGPDTLSSAWTVSRKDVAHFIAVKCLKNWDDWKGKQVTLAY